MTDALDAPADLLDRTTTLADDHAGAGLARDPDALNVVVAGADDLDPATTLTDDGYEGPHAPAAANLAALLAALADPATDAEVCLHHPEPAGTARGPWLVLAPLGGRLSTVSVGRGRLTVELAAAAPVSATLRRLLDAAEPAHEHYPVESDDLGVFTTGMETATLRRVDATGPVGGATVTFHVSVTPATTAADVEARYASVEGVADAAFEVVAGVERAAPPDELRTAAQDASVAELGDCEYDWLPEPSTFARLPGGEKLGLGTPRPGADRVDRDTVDACRAILRGTLDRLANAPGVGSPTGPEVGR